MVVLPQPFGAQFAKDKQWGVKTTSFPIAFSSVYSIACSNGQRDNTDNPSWRCFPYDITNTGFGIYIQKDFRWIAVGR